MRSSKSRSRGNKNRNNRPSGGNIINRVFDSSGPDGKVRGTPQQIIEKYNQLHRDAQLAGDRVNAENFAQHAEHYTRMLAEAMREVERAREESEQFNRERQAERDRERAARQNRFHNEASVEEAPLAQDEDLVAVEVVEQPIYADEPYVPEVSDNATSVMEVIETVEEEPLFVAEERSVEPRHSEPRSSEPRQQQRRPRGPRKDQPAKAVEKGGEGASQKPRIRRPRKPATEAAE